MAVFRLARLINRNGRLYYRRVVPKDVRETIGKAEWKIALGLRYGEEAEALIKCRQLDRETDQQIAYAKHAISLEGSTECFGPLQHFETTF